jgi:D-amino peptidase
VLLVTGDSATCDEGRELLGEGLTTVAVKQGTGRFGARNLAPKRARELIEAGAKQALSNLGAVPPYDPGRPCEIRVVFHHSDGVAPVRHKPGVEVVGAREIVSRADDWWSAWRQFFL